MISFQDKIEERGLDLDRQLVNTLQVNIGKLCNQACHHCHVDAGPLRTENMELKTINRIIELLDRTESIQRVDVTGGAPELNPHFRHFVRSCFQRGIEVIDRCNLTVLFEEGQEETGQFLAEHRVNIVASLPCYTEDNVDRQRGRGVFEKSIEGLKLLNKLGYGQDKSSLQLNLVYNPLGPSLPPTQADLERDYKKQLMDEYGILFNNLFTITNMPIKRFLTDLHRQGRLQEYMALLVSNFNDTAAENVMCKSLLSVSWDGQIFDCDFNQMLDMPVRGAKKTLWDVESFSELNNNPIVFEDHCYGCAAGAGSSCEGSLA